MSAQAVINIGKFSLPNATRHCVTSKKIPDNLLQLQLQL
jgi:hypothetical protein